MAPNSTIVADGAEPKISNVLPEDGEDRSLNAFRKLCNTIDGEDIVIAGIAGKYPNSENLHQFRDNLYEQVDLITEDDRRWRPYPGVPLRSGKLNDITSFDAGFFGVDQCQVNLMDPIIRLLLERTFEAVIDAGYNPSELKERKVGVFIGNSFSESEKVIMYNKMVENGRAPIGATFSMIPQSISYYFGLQGPSYISDSGCSSSLYVLAHAFKNLREGTCDMALVGGANLCLHAVMSLQYARLGVLSKDGNCKTFDSSANGFVRSESVSVILLQKSKDARRVYARVLHSKQNCDGFKEEGFAFPSTEMQATLITETYQECNIDASDVDYVEAHGTGTYVGDAQELLTLTNVFCRKERRHPLYIGSVKSNAGHTECTAGLTSIAKIIISMENGYIPGNRNYINPRQGFDALQKGQLKVVAEKTPWPQQGNGIAGINSFGIGGANAHAVLQWNTKLKCDSFDDLPRLVCVSGRNKGAVDAILDSVSGKPLDTEFVQLMHSAFGKDVINHPWRGFALIDKDGVVQRSVKDSLKSELVWVFNSFDSNWYKIAKGLMVFPVFLNQLEKLQKRIQKKTQIDVMEIIKFSKTENTLEKIVATLAVQISLGETLKSLGIKPDSTIGVGTGEITAAYFKNFLSLDEVIFICVSIGALFCKKNGTNNVNGVPFFYKIFKNMKAFLPNLGAQLKALLSPLVANGNAATFFNADLIEYFVRNKSAATLEARKEFLMHNATTLVIGAEIENFEKFSLVVENSQDLVTSFLTSLGTMYENGHSLELCKLYPQLPWPVGRGTPMISPLIKWNNNDQWYVALKKDENDVRNGQRVVHVTPKEPEWKYVTGHVVDGRNLFPATGYLTIVWETLAKTVGKEMVDMRVTFEDVKFLRAVNLTGRDDVELTVTIQQGDDKFEVTEAGIVAVTGRIYETPDDQELTKLHVPSEDCVEGVTTMNHDDIYKELGIRGYNFSGPFKGLKECDIAANKGLVTWKGNWALFLDSMLQMRVLHVDTRNLRVPVFIKNLMIDGPKHARFLGGNLEQEATLPVYVHIDTDLTRSVAVEYRGTITREVQKKKSGVQVLEKYKFVPNETSLGLSESVRVMVQVILENNSALKFKSVEVASDSELLSPYVKRAVDDLPSVQAELVALSPAPLEVPGVKVENYRLCNEKEALIVIISDLTADEQLFSEALDAIKDTNGYIIARETGFFDSSLPTFHGMNILNIHNHKFESLILLQKPAEYDPPVVFNVSNNNPEDLSWLPLIQKAVKEGQNVTLYSQNKSTSGILGFTNCLKKEPYDGRVSCFFIVDEAPEFDLGHPFYARQAEKNLAVNVWKDGKWGSYRHLLIDENFTVKSRHCFANITNRGDLSSVKFVEGPLHNDVQVAVEKQLIDVYYSAVNFRDVMTASGKLNIDNVTKIRAKQECVQGLEFAGLDKTGKRVMGLVTSKALSNYVVANSQLLWPVPDAWSLEDAATVPVAYAVVVYGLIMRAKLQRCQSILIHAATGAVGQAAINVALHFGCDVFLTVEMGRKRDYLIKKYPQIPESHIASSKDTAFEHMIRSETNGRGVDVVLNSLPEEKLLASLRCLATDGRFVEIGRFDIDKDNQLDVEEFADGISFHSVLLEAIFKSKSDVKEQLFNHMTQLLENDVIKPLPRTVFDKCDIADAYKCMGNGKHLGKVLVKIQKEQGGKSAGSQIFEGAPRYYCHSENSYVILGGLGGFGLELADWLIIRGARKLILTSRSGVKNGYAAHRIRLWKTYGVKAEIRTDDVSTEKGCKDLLDFANSLGPVKAIFNLAVVLKDALFENQTEENYAAVLNPKAVATRYMDALSRQICPQLSDFVVFSSLSCGRGNAGQTNYGMANSVMERICERRKADGYPALAVQWGAIGDVGIVADIQRKSNTEMTIGGTLQQRISNCLQVMDSFLRQDEPIVASMLVAEKRSFNSASDMVEVVSNMLGVVDLSKISMHSTFPELGMDSMTSLEIKQVLENDYDILLLEQDIRAMTFARLKELAEAKLAEKEAMK